MPISLPSASSTWVALRLDAWAAADGSVAGKGMKMRVASTTAAHTIGVTSSTSKPVKPRTILRITTSTLPRGQRNQPVTAFI